MPPLLSHLQLLEVELHHPGVRCSRERLEQLLHPQFHEVGRSGRKYDRETIVRFLAEQQTHARVESSNFAVHLLAEGCAHLTYESVQRCADGTLQNHALRSSIWMETPAGWQLFYHQGTPGPVAA
jgi:hypothetical protein